MIRAEYINSYQVFVHGYIVDIPDKWRIRSTKGSSWRLQKPDHDTVMEFRNEHREKFDGDLTRVKSEFINKITLRLCQYPSMHFFLPAQTKAEKTKVHIPKADTNRTVKYQITAHHGIACPIERKKVYMQHYQMMRPDIFQKNSNAYYSTPYGRAKKTKYRMENKEKIREEQECYNTIRSIRNSLNK